MKKPTRYLTLLTAPLALTLSAGSGLAGDTSPSACSKKSSCSKESSCSKKSSCPKKSSCSSDGVTARAEAVVRDCADLVCATVKAPIAISTGLLCTVCPKTEGPGVIAAVTDLTGAVGDLASSTTELGLAPIDAVHGALETHGGTPGKVVAAPTSLATRTLRQVVDVSNTVLHMGDGGGSVTVESAAPYGQAPKVEKTSKFSKRKLKVRRGGKK